MKPWKRVAGRDAVTKGKVSAFEVDGSRLCIVEAGGSLHAFQSRCPHMRAPLSEATVSGGAIECPLHHASFRVNTGEVAGEPQMGGSMPGMDRLPQETLQAFMHMGALMAHIDCPNLTVHPVRETQGSIEVQL